MALPSGYIYYDWIYKLEDGKCIVHYKYKVIQYWDQINSATEIRDAMKWDILYENNLIMERNIKIGWKWLNNASLVAIIHTNIALILCLGRPQFHKKWDRYGQQE